ncbi:MAG TPA: undecaprenyl/decaprenyl-phosphate alpha-N-acetylglucosaminyl 1-phosphate transferase [Gammaproteobacteria bacterium]|nr:undecaprenyl/decaprenyl-phosphate alpha-N-acetylglucosaminyl 1-phosphate transferase [Gammaproteobacteria bacterium]
MNLLFVLLTAMVASMVLIPFMIRLAPHIGMVDQPDERKVHLKPIPRVGGIGIVLGTLLAIIIWLPQDSFLWSYLLGSLVLFVFGALDDSFELGHYVKFIGQFIAVGIIVFAGDVRVEHIPFLDSPLSEYASKSFSFIAIVGVINAINHSDGLDGLAGGESLLSLACLAYLAIMIDEANSAQLLIMIFAVIGGILGFMRFNNHPAQIFMGDAGSQFLGYSLAIFTIILTQKVHTSVSMALPVLILGLPIVDILAVFVQRIYHGMNWFRASKNHIHHRLLELGFDHYQSVIIIYSVQVLLVLCAVNFRYASDGLVMGLYLIICGSLFLALYVSEKNNWNFGSDGNKSRLTNFVDSLREKKLFTEGPLILLKLLIPAYFIIGSVLITSISTDFVIELAVIGFVLILSWIIKRSDFSTYLVRIGIYAMAVIMVYLLDQQVIPESGWLYYIDIVFFAVLSVTVAVVVRYARQINFSVTPFDYLMVVLVIAAGIVQQNYGSDLALGYIVIKSVILFYGCEVAVNNRKSDAGNLLGAASLVAAAVLLFKVAATQ